MIDASVCVKWLVVEDRHNLARDVLRTGFQLLGPDLLLIEVANALRNKVRGGLIGEPQAKAAIDVLPRFFDSLFPPAPMLAKAFDLACQINHPVADCLHLACALENAAALLTDDATLHKKAQALDGQVKVVLLSDWTPGLPAFSSHIAPRD